MPVDFVEGFDRYANVGSLSFIGRWATNFGDDNNIASLQAGRFGGRCLFLNSVNSYRQMERLVTPSNRVGLQVAFLTQLSRLPTIPYEIVSWRTSTGARQAGWGIDNFGRIRVFDANSNVVFVSEGFEVANNGWTFIEMHVEHHASLGKIRLKINGETIYNGTNLNTGSANTDKIRFQTPSVTQATVPDPPMQYRLDDMAVSVDEDETLGESAALIFRPASDVSAQFTRLSGTANAEMVDEEQADGETTYNSSNTVGHTDIFELTDLATSPESVKAVFISICARKLDSGTRQLEYFLEIGETEYTLDTVYLGASYEFYETVVELNPATGLPWEPSEVNALRVGYRVIE